MPKPQLENNLRMCALYVTLEYHPAREGGWYQKFSLKEVSETKPDEPHVVIPSRKAMWDIEPETTYLLVRCDEKIMSVEYATDPKVREAPGEWLVDFGILLKANSDELPTLPLDDSY